MYVRKIDWRTAADLAIIELDAQAEFSDPKARGLARCARRARDAGLFRAAARCYVEWARPPLFRIPNRSTNKRWARGLYEDWLDCNDEPLPPYAERAAAEALAVIKASRCVNAHRIEAAENAVAAYLAGAPWQHHLCWDEADPPGAYAKILFRRVRNILLCIE